MTEETLETIILGHIARELKDEIQVGRQVKLAETIMQALRTQDVMVMLPTSMINRVEVIDENGRSYVNWKPTNRTEIQVQDNGRTLKVFVSQGD